MKKLKQNDEVVVITGSLKGKKGKIQSIDTKNETVLIEGLVSKKNKKRTEYSEGGIIDIPKPIHKSNVMLVSSNGKATRVGIKEEKGKRVRFEKKTSKVIG